MSIPNVYLLIVNLNTQSHWLRLIGDPRFDNAFAEHRAVEDEMHSTEGVEQLRLRYEADGNFSNSFREWIIQQRAALILRMGCDESIVDRMPVAEFVSAVNGDDTPSRDQNGRALEALMGEETGEMMKIAQSDDTADNRMRRIFEIDRRVAAWKSNRWADLLNTTDGNIRKSRWWKVDRNQILRRDADD